MKGWILLIPLLVIGYVAFRPALKAKPVTNPNVSNIAGVAGTRVDILEAARRRGHDVAIFGAGCFWGVESQFRATPGVVATAVGFSGGTRANATYHEVCNDDTGHAEVVLVEFDPKILPYRKLVEGFFEIHDPTSVNSQGPDYGSQYRSAIFTYGESQLAAAKAVRDELGKSGRYDKPIATQITSAGPFWIAEDYHQQYYEKKGYPPGKGLCAAPG